jgi:DNA helicase HerA-like ATPase
MLGTVLSVTGSRMTVRLTPEGTRHQAMRLGSVVEVPGGEHRILGTVASAELDSASGGYVMVVELIGEISGSGKDAGFTRGVSYFPIPGDEVTAATDEDLRKVYARPSRSNIRIGTLYHNADQPAYLSIDDLLGKHFAIVGSTGSGKSSAVTLVLLGILQNNPQAHIILLDPHNEYAAAFGDLAEAVNVDNLQLPFWLFDFEEMVRILVRGGTPQEHESQALILKDVIARARRTYAGDASAAKSITVDSPTPLQISDVVRLLNDAMGKIDKADTSLPYLRLRTRIESLREDRRFKFMFPDSFSTPDTLSEVVGRLLRIPVNGKPLTVVDLSGVPSEITDVVVSMLCRLLFDFALWSPRDRMPPMLLVCEEAHRYVPQELDGSFAAAAHAVTRLAKEGRKYGISLGLVSQRPSELSSEALSQCGTVFALRLGNELDQEFVARTVADAARGLLSSLPSLPARQAIVSGEGVPIPMRIRFDDLPPERRPLSKGADFSTAWQTDATDAEFRDEGVRRWRLQSR